MPFQLGHPPGRVTEDRIRRREGFVAVAVVVTLVGAWLFGAATSRMDVTPFLHRALPAADRFVPLEESVHAGYLCESLVGYVVTTEAPGYGGPIHVAVAVDEAGSVLGTTVIQHNETPSFYRRVLSRGFARSLAGKPYSDPFELGQDLDAVTGASATSRALAEAVREGARSVARTQLGRRVPEPQPPAIRFGVPEVAVLALYLAAFLGARRGFRYARPLRWATLSTGLLVLGFWYNMPLTLSKISSLLLGFWPSWRTDLYWYLLIGGLLLLTTTGKKNLYCGWFCPFGAAQEGLAAIGGARLTVPRRQRLLLLWVHRGLAWLALMLALGLRNPGVSSYEVFPTLFDFTGSWVLFALLGIVLVMSLFVRRPWCRFLCPLDPVYDSVLLARNRMGELWKRARVGGDGLSG